MSDRGADIKRQGWASSRSSSGEGPDEVTVNEESINQGEVSSPNYSTTTGNLTAATYNTEASGKHQELEFNEPSALAADDDDLKSKLKELNIGSLDDDGGGGGGGQDG